MDPLKLLLRATNLNQAAEEAKLKLAFKQLPSAGAPARPQIFSELSSGDKIPLVNGQGTKRKRESEAKNGGVYKAPNFFDRPPPGGKATSKIIDSDAESIQSEEQEAENDDLASQWKTESECKQILRAHKLKVAVIEAPSLGGAKPVHDEYGESQSKEAQTKHVFVPIYPQPLESFVQLRKRYGLSKRLVASLKSQGFSIPTEVQLGSLPILLGDDRERGLADLSEDEKRKPSEERTDRSAVDLITIAPTGSGKTLAFLLSTFQGLLENRQKATAVERKNHVEAIIIAPTHELVDQIVSEAKRLTRGIGLKITAMRKGMKIGQERSNADDVEENDEKLKVKSDVLVSTPLLLLNAITNKDGGPTQAEALPSVRYLVLDEADVLLDPLFREQTLGIWRQCDNPNLQVSFWSATIGSSIESLAQSFIEERRRRLSISDERHKIIRLIAGLRDSALPVISHRLTYAATEQGKLIAIRQLLHPTGADHSDEAAALRPPFIIFTQSIPRAIALHSELEYDIPAEAGGSKRLAVMHADLSESARSNIMAEFRKGEIWVIITTDLLSRGVDFRGVNGVVNYDIPNTAAAYVHRVGRTGRAGREGGVAVTLYTKEDITYVRNVVNVIAASEKARGITLGSKESALQPWLMDALPAVSKKTKQKLKKRGVEGRRPVKQGEGDDAKAVEGRKMRISTTSGYDRKMENRKRGAIEGSRRRKKLAGQKSSDGDANGIDDGNADNDVGGGEWQGIDD